MMTVQECIKYAKDHLEVRYAINNGAYTAGKFLTPKGAVNHSVGCAQPRADVFFNQMNKSSAGWAVNAILGDFHMGEGRIILTLPYNARPWGCGSGKNGSWNNSKIQWEICEPSGHTYAGGTMVNYDVKKNQEYFDRMWKLLVCWNVYMVDMFGYDISEICDHTEAAKAGYGSNHSDVNQWFPKHGKSMEALRNEVKAIFDYTEEDDENMDAKKFGELLLEYRATLQDNDASSWSEESREWAVENGIIAGGGSGEFNGMWHDFLTREQMAVMLHRFAKLMGKA